MFAPAGNRISTPYSINPYAPRLEILHGISANYISSYQDGLIFEFDER
jgi:hypothetical protein